MNNQFKYGVLLLSYLVLSFVAMSAWAIVIVYPQDGTYVTKSNHLIVQGDEDQLLDGITIEIDGIKSDIIDLSSEAYRSLYGNKLVVEPLFDPGENTIIVEGYLRDDKVATARASVYYLEDEATVPPENFRKEGFHLASREESCVACHNMQPSKVQLQDPTVGNPCASCHARMLNREYVHGPAGVYECSYCHDIESQPVKYQSRVDVEELCLECHDVKSQGKDAMSFLHGPVAVGMCLVCHDPHASDQPKQLVAEVNQLCLNCHASVRDQPHVTNMITGGKSHPLEGPENPRMPNQKYNCSSCHNPHGGKVEQYFVNNIESGFALCQECHDR